MVTFPSYAVKIFNNDIARERVPLTSCGNEVGTWSSFLSNILWLVGAEEHGDLRVLTVFNRRTSFKVRFLKQIPSNLLTMKKMFTQCKQTCFFSNKQRLTPPEKRELFGKAKRSEVVNFLSPKITIAVSFIFSKIKPPQMLDHIPG